MHFLSRQHLRAQEQGVFRLASAPEYTETKQLPNISYTDDTPATTPQDRQRESIPGIEHYISAM